MKYAVVSLVKNSSENIIILFVRQKVYNSRRTWRIVKYQRKRSG